jgi:hypothetical protein
MQLRTLAIAARPLQQRYRGDIAFDTAPILRAFLILYGKHWGAPITRTEWQV